DYIQVENALAVYGTDRLAHEIKTTFSVIRETIEAYRDEPNTLRKVANPTAGGNPIKTPFCAICMSFFDLVVQQEQSLPTRRG
ncbi:MAG: GmrSD restriction endonuclease domain-containing protein, partial [Ktedonobacterales bacterium]